MRWWRSRQTWRIRGCCRICCTATRRGCGAIKRIADRAACWRSAPQAQDFTCQRYRYKDRVDEVERAKNSTKAKVRSKVEHVFAVIDRKFGFVKVRYRGIAKAVRLKVEENQLVGIFGEIGVPVDDLKCSDHGRFRLQR